MKEALLQIKADLGENAVLISHSKVSKGLFGGEEIEVMAGVDDEAPGLPKTPSVSDFGPIRLGSAVAKPGNPGLYGPPRPQSTLATDSLPSMPPDEAPGPLTLPPKVRPWNPPRLTTKQAPEPAFPPPDQSARPVAQPANRFAPKRSPDEIAELKADFHELKDLIKGVLTSGSPRIASVSKEEAGVTTAGDMEWDAFVKKLTDAEVKPEIARKLVNSIRGGLQITDAELEEKLFDALTEQFPVSGPLKLRKDSPLIVSFVGPTGSGKTTTLAKLAAYCRLNNKSVSIITADSYRIAAYEQIRAFAEIMNISLQMVFSPDEVNAALEECGDCDVIFVDNAGRSQRDKDHMEELRLMMDVLRPDETHLVLSATTKDSDLLDMINRYRNIKVNRLLFTKLDETTRLGNIFNIVSDLGIPVSYFTLGQSVPDDIELARAATFVERLLMGGRAR
jgi:flagellar biosynthesis protein FlhF